MKNICFVSTEIYPITTGGIGKLLFDTIEHLDRSGLYKISLLLLAMDSQYKEFNSYAYHNFKNVNVYSLDKVLSNLDEQENIPLWAFHFEEYYLSYRVALALRILNTIHKFETIEFCDYLGLGYVPLKWKKLMGGEFENTSIQVKLHGTKEICDIADGEKTYTKRQMVTYHMEKYCLSNCDQWIVPSKAISQYYISHYGIESKKTSVSIPKFEKIGKGNTHGRHKTVPSKFMFYGKVQKLKGIETFIKGGIKVLEDTNPEAEFHIYGHTVYYQWCGSYEEYLKKMIPEKWAKNFVFKGRINIADLENVAKEYTAAVVPSKFETFCLAAHELNWIGIPLILNNIAAFEDYFTSKDAFLFDGSADSLAEIMSGIIADHKRAALLRWNASDIAKLATDSLTDLSDKAEVGIVSKAQMQYPLVSVIIPYYNMHAYVEDAVKSVYYNDYPNKEIIIVNDGSTLEESIKKLEKLRQDYPDVMILDKKNGGLGSARNYGIRQSKGEYIICLDSDDILHRKFISTSITALERNRSLMAVSCYVNFFMDGSTTDKHIDYVIPYDLVPELIFIENRAGVATSVFRRKVYDQINYNEELTSYEDWDFWWQCVRYGFQAEVIPVILFHYRRRGDSMINTEGLKKHIYHVHKMIEINKEWIQSHGPVVFQQMTTLLNELFIQNLQLQNQVGQVNAGFPAGNNLNHSTENIYAQLNSVQEWYNKEYEVLPIWFKRIGHIVKVFQGNRKFKSLFEKTSN